MKNNLGANIKTFRKNKGFTQEELAGMLGVTPQAVSRWESEAGLPDVSMIVPIAQTLNITTDALLGYQVLSQDDRVSKQVFEKMKEFEDVFLCGMTLEQLKKQSNIKNIRINRDGGYGFVDILAER